jgi:mRNA-capping enzyme
MSLYQFLPVGLGESEGEIHDVHTEPITCLLFDNAGKYVLTAGDKHVRVFHNVPGLKTAVQVTIHI